MESKLSSSTGEDEISRVFGESIAEKARRVGERIRLLLG